MAKLLSMPNEGMISGFRHKIDFYFHDGIACVRRWPRPPSGQRSPAVKEGWAPFSYASKEWANLSQAVKDAYIEMAGTSGLNGRDVQQRAYIKGIYRNPIP